MKTIKTMDGAIDRRTLLGDVAVAAASATVVGALGSAAHAADAARGPVADTQYGPIRGLEHDGIKVFLGVPYGDDTAGANRWLPPKPAKPWKGVRLTQDYGPAPPQTTPISAPMQEETDMLQKSPISEDCLRINIYTPAVGKGSGKRAVMVWFHGGGFSSGSGNAAQYRGENLCKKQDVVVVSVTQRLNHFGHLYLADIFGGAYADSGNVGMLDAVAALKWIHHNIANFGGDPGRVLVFGQSGGGGKVSTLMGMPAAKGLFHRAAAQSGAAVTSNTTARAAAAAKRLIDALGVTTIEQAQALPWTKIVEVANANRGAGGFGPVVDGRSLPANVFDPAASELSHDVPLISSTVETESAAWGAPVDPIDDATLLKLTKQATRLSDDDSSALLDVFRKTYPGRENTYLIQTLMSQWTFATPNVILQAERKAAQAATGGAKDYFFYFGHHTTVRNGRLHAPHTSEIPYCFDSLEASAPIIGPVTPEKQALADIVSRYWANFAKTGDPNGKGLPEWKPFNTETWASLVVTPSDEVHMVDDPMGPTRKAIAALRPKAQPMAGA